MNDHLKDILAEAAGDGQSGTDPLADLARGQRAARMRNARRLRVGSAALAIVAVAGVSVAQVVGDSDDPSSSSTAGSAVQLVSEQLDAGVYTFDLTPRGWSVQAQNAFGVTIAPDDGSTSTNPHVFVGKLVILFDQNPLSGTKVVANGREFWLGGDSDYTAIATRTSGDEPTGVVRIQYPDHAGWTRATMLAFLGSVHVGAGAKPGQG